MRIVVSFLSLFLPLYLLAQNGQARQPNVMVVPFVEPGEGENDRIKDAVLNDEAVPLALSKIKEEFNLRNFKTIDFMTEFQRVQNRAYAASALNAKSTGLQAYVDGARADIYVTVKISKEDFAGGASNVTLLMEAKERETGFSLANASIVSDRFRASKKELTEYALEGISENFFNQLKQAFRDMVTNGREVNITLNVDENCDFDMDILRLKPAVFFPQFLLGRRTENQQQYDKAAGSQPHTEKQPAQYAQRPLPDGRINSVVSLCPRIINVVNFAHRE